MSGTEESSHYYKSIVPDSFIYGDFDEDVIWKLLERQKRILDNNLPNGKVFVLLDDCAYSKKAMSSKALSALAKNGRHFNITVLLTIQYALDIPPDIRNNIDFFFCFADNVQLNQKKLYDHYFGNFENLQVFKDVFKACTRNYEVLVLNNLAKSGELQDTVFWYKAALHEPFRIGHKSFWKYHHQTYAKKEHQDDESSRMVRGSRIKVVKKE